MSTIILNNGVTMPLLGFGVFQITDLKLCEESVLNAIKSGYRLIDTAESYGNEEAVGAAITKSGVPREELFISSKVWVNDIGYDKTIAAFEKTLKKLGTDYLDLYLIHMPYGDYYGAWRAMEDLYRDGKIKAIGVCNFLEDRLIDLIKNHSIIPAINQIEMHPFSQRKELRSIMNHYGITTMAWAPFAEGRNNIFTNEVLSKIGNKYQKTAAQVILKWLTQMEIVTIPKSVHLERIQQNFDIEDFALDAEDLILIENMDEGHPLILDVRDVYEVFRLNKA